MHICLIVISSLALAACNQHVCDNKQAKIAPLYNKLHKQLWANSDNVLYYFKLLKAVPKDMYGCTAAMSGFGMACYYQHTCNYNNARDYYKKASLFSQDSKTNTLHIRVRNGLQKKITITDAAHQQLNNH